MKKINFLTLLIATLVSISAVNDSIAQTSGKGKGKGKVYVEAIDDGRVLNQADIRFFNSISGNGNDSHTAVVFAKKFTAGQRLTSNDAAALNLAKSEYRKKHKLQKAEDGKTIDRNHYPSSYWYAYNDNGSDYYVWYCD